MDIYRMKRFLGITFALLCLFTSVQAQKAVVDKVVAVIGGNPILMSELNQQYTLYLSQGNPPNETVKCYILQQMLAQKLLKQQAAIDSVVVAEPEVADEVDRRMRYQVSRAGGQENLEKMLGRSLLQYKDEIHEDVKEQLVSNRMQSKITENISVTPQEVKKYFDSYKKDSLPDIGAEVEVGEIVFNPVLNKAEKQRFIDKLEGFRKRIKDGEDFAFLARTYSQDPVSAAEGGDLGFFDRSQMVKEFTAYAFKLKAGEISPVFESEHGFHILQVIERRAEQVHARHILIRPEMTNESLARIKLQADSVYDNIQGKKITFAAAAAQYSADKNTKYTGGMLLYSDNQTVRTTYIPVEKLDPKMYVVIDTMKENSLSKPVFFTSENGSQGYKLIYLKSKIPPHKASLAQDYPKFKERAQQEKVDKALSLWFEKRRENTSIKIDPEFAACDELKIWEKAAKK